MGAPHVVVSVRRRVGYASCSPRRVYDRTKFHPNWLHPEHLYYNYPTKKSLEVILAEASMRDALASLDGPRRREIPN